jgi:hypothetical protein
MSMKIWLILVFAAILAAAQNISSPETNLFSVDVNSVPSVATIEIAADAPGAAMIRAGTTNAHLLLRAGEYKIKLTLRGYAPFEEKLVVGKSSSNSVIAKLQKLQQAGDNSKPSPAAPIISLGGAPPSAKAPESAKGLDKDAVSETAILSSQTPAQTAPRPKTEKPQSWHLVRYAIYGKEPASITYRDEFGNVHQEYVPLPWDLKFQAPSGTPLYVSAQKRPDILREAYCRSRERECADRNITFRNHDPINSVIYLDTIPMRDVSSNEEFGIATASGEAP